MPSHVPLRDVWNFQQERLSSVWTLHREPKTAECVAWSHHFGWELRLTVDGGLIQSRVGDQPRNWSAGRKPGERRWLRRAGFDPMTRA